MKEFPLKLFPLKLFTDSGQYTREALDLNMETFQVLLPIFKKWMDIGFDPRMISHVMFHAVFDIELEEMMDVIYDINMVGTWKENQ